MSRGRVFKSYAGFLSLAGSHSVAFLRCLQNGIQGPDGYHCSIAKSDPAWKAIEEGWTWVVLAASIEEAIPQLPNFIQMAANSTNSISKAINELEVALQIASGFEKGLSLPEAVRQASQGDVRCRASIPHIARFVQQFGGGSHGFPLLHFLANFSRQFNATLLVGQEVMATLATFDFRDATCMFPMLRVAYWATLLTSPKTQAGFAKIITRSDLEKLRSDSMRSQVEQAETILQDAWKVQVSLGETYHQAHMIKCYGRLNVRTILFLTGKQKSGRDGTHWQTLQAILGAYTKEVQDAAGTKATSSAQHEPQAEMKVTDVLSASARTIALLQNHHMEIGQLLLGVEI